MAKQDIINQIKLLGLDEQHGLTNESMDAMHWKELEKILNNHNKADKVETKPEQSDELLALVKQLKAEIDELKSRNSSPSGNIVVQMPDKDEVWGKKKRVSLDKGDFEQSPTTFLCWGRGEVVASYFKDGEELLAPYGAPIEFKYTNANVRNIDGAEKLLHISTYRTNSKKEKEWIRNHPKYGRGIYEKVEQMITYNPQLASALESVAISIGTLSAQDIFAKANALGLDATGSNIDKLKMNIITLEAQRLLEHDNKQQGGQMAQMLEDKLKSQTAY